MVQGKKAHTMCTTHTYTTHTHTHTHTHTPQNHIICVHITHYSRNHRFTALHSLTHTHTHSHNTESHNMCTHYTLQQKSQISSTSFLKHTHTHTHTHTPHTTHDTHLTWHIYPQGKKRERVGEGCFSDSVSQMWLRTQGRSRQGTLSHWVWGLEWDVTMSPKCKEVLRRLLLICATHEARSDGDAGVWSAGWGLSSLGTKRRARMGFLSCL